MHFDAGKLNRRIEIICKTESINDYGQTVYGDKVYKKVWAQITPQRSYEQNEIDRLTPITTSKCVIRYLKGLTSDMTIMYNGKMYEIISIIDVDEGHYCHELTIKLRGDH